jgi:methylthioribose-1-phosphate isomerase
MSDQKAFQIQHMSLRYKKGKAPLILDQTKLPKEESWVECSSLETMEEAIKKLKVRGAPMIGLSANMFLSYWSSQNQNVDELYKASEVLKNSRPTAVNLIHYMNEFQKNLKATKSTEWIEAWAEDKWDEDVLSSTRMSTFGMTVLKPGATVLTHCNTGGLAASGGGTALGVITKAHEVFQNIHVYVDETRPLLQGGRLTTWELSQKQVPYTLICDNMAASLMQQKKIDAIFVGADRIASNGDTANKIGTYSLAVNAKHHGVPFYIVAPSTTVDSALITGEEIPVEQRSAEEVQGFVHPENTISWAPEGCEVYNPAFDVTPQNLITGWITEAGVINHEDIAKGAFKK